MVLIRLLTYSEKLAAISSPYANWITELDYKHVRDDAQGLVTLIKFNYKRGAHFQCLAQMVYCIEKLPGRSEPTTTRVQSWLKRVDAPGPQLQREIEAVLGTYWFIANDENLKRPFDVKNKVAPVEFVFIGKRSMFSGFLIPDFCNRRPPGRPPRLR